MKQMWKNFLYETTFMSWDKTDFDIVYTYEQTFNFRN